MIGQPRAMQPGYLAKYIAKNIDAPMSVTTEANTPADQGALHCVRLGQLVGIRTFQRIGAPLSGCGASCAASATPKHGDLVGPPKPVLQDPRFEAARYAADNGIFRCYLEAMGGALSTRAEHPIKASPPHRGRGQPLRRRHQAPDGAAHRSPGYQDPPAKGGKYQQAPYEPPRPPGVRVGV